MEFLSEFFCNSGYSKFLVQKLISNFLNSPYEQSVMNTESCKSVYSSLTHFGQYTERKFVLILQPKRKSIYN